jgi:signal transduction histidine kinase
MIIKKSLYTTLYKSILTLFSVFIILAIFFNALLSYTNFIQEKEKLQDEILNAKKTSMKNEIDFFISNIQISRDKLQEQTKKELKKRVEIAYNIAYNLYIKNQKNLPIKNIIIESLRELKFYDIGDQYVFMTKLDGTFLLVSGLQHLEGKNVFNLQTESNKESIRNIIEMVKTKKEGYFEYRWQNHNTLKYDQKISYFKYFEPFDCYIGTGVFLTDIEEKLKKNFLEKISNFRFGKNMQNYIFSASYEGISYTNPAENKNVYNTVDLNGKKVVQELIKTAKNGSGFVKYVVPMGKDKSLDKISYVVGIDKWQLYIGYGETYKDINTIIEHKKEELLRDLYQDIILTLVLGILFLMLFYFLFKNIKISVSNDINYLIQSITKLVNENKEIELKKIQFNEFEQIALQTNQLQKNKTTIENTLKEKELLLYQQSKMAAMGELLENIAHQWRQPLSLITVSSTGIQVKKEYGQLDDKFLDESLENINANAEYLSNTIDDFRNFFVTSITKEYFKIDKIIDKTLKLINLRDKDNEINIIKQIETIEVDGFKNQLLQVLLVIFNNAYDALENLTETKLLFIDVSKSNDLVSIVIKDNAGGINLQNIEKIFEPYFTTKHKTKGTGIGLYMAKEIVTNQLQGNLTVTNETYTYKKKEYKGAQFIITFPASV